MSDYYNRTKELTENGYNLGNSRQYIYPYRYGYVCSSCMRVFETYSHCERHILRFHRGEEEYVPIWSVDMKVFRKTGKINHFYVDDSHV